MCSVESFLDVYGDGRNSTKKQLEIALDTYLCTPLGGIKSVYEDDFLKIIANEDLAALEELFSYNGAVHLFDDVYAFRIKGGKYGLVNRNDDELGKIVNWRTMVSWLYNNFMRDEVA